VKTDLTKCGDKECEKVRGEGLKGNHNLLERAFKRVFNCLQRRYILLFGLEGGKGEIRLRGK
jgi:hypothetical protein